MQKRITKYGNINKETFEICVSGLHGLVAKNNPHNPDVHYIDKVWQEWAHQKPKTVLGSTFEIVGDRTAMKILRAVEKEYKSTEERRKFLNKK
jgi:hypothetical protein